jgi:hypothetical protein
MSQLKGLKVSTPKFNDTIPSTGEKVKLKPFRVADEKVLMLAGQSEDPNEIVNAIEQIIDNCVERNSKTPLSYFDFEYLFVKLRSISVGEVAKFGYKCVSCDHVNQVSIDISKVKIKTNEDKDRNIKISDNLMFRMRYPTVSTIFKSDENSYDSIINLIVDCVETVYHGEDAITVTEAEKEDLKDIIENLSSSQYKGLSEFIDKMPKLREETSFKCEACEKENKVVLEGLKSFF